MCTENDFSFWVPSEKFRRQKIEILLPTQKLYPVGVIETCFHLGRLDETEVYFQLSRTHCLVEWRKTNTKWKFHNFANLTVIAASLKDELMGCGVLPELLPKKHPMNCPTYDESTSQSHNDSLSLFGLFFSNCTENESWKKNENILFVLQ